MLPTFGFSNFGDVFAEGYEVCTELAEQVKARREEGATLRQATPLPRLEKLDLAVRQTLKELGFKAKEIDGRDTWIFYPYARGKRNAAKAAMSRFALKRIAELSDEMPALAYQIKEYERANGLAEWSPV